MIYPTIEQVENFHNLIIELIGGKAGIIDLGQVESVLFHIQNDDYYPDFVDKITHLFYSLCCFHSFTDGNKRTALVSGAFFLYLNGYNKEIISTFLKQLENISVMIAANKIDKDTVKEIIRLILN